MNTIEALRELASVARVRAYAPYSHFRVGCALEAEDGTIFQGCNVENAAFGVTLCAERVALGAAVAAGHRKFSRIAIVSDAAGPASPCGECRQALAEFGPHIEVHSFGAEHGHASWRSGELLPAVFEFPQESERHG